MDQAARFTTMEEAARSGMYRLLARLWLREIDQEFLGRLCAPPLRDLFVDAGGVLPANDDATAIEQLAVDYCQLFVGPADHLPPIQSVWQTSQFQSAATTSMRIFIDVVGYPSDVLPSGTMLDHLSVQLDVMGHILAQISNCPAGDETLGELLELANSFLASHLTWPTELLRAAEGQAETEFYRSMITLTRDFLNSEFTHSRQDTN